MDTTPYTTQLGISVARGGEGCFLEKHISVRRVFARALGLLAGIKAMLCGISGGKKKR